jgi:hypothetical protein
VAVLAIETSTWEAAAVQDGGTLHVKDVEDWATLVEWEALERVSRAEAENATTLASSREDTEGLAWKVALLEDELTMVRRAQEVSKREHRAHMEELTLLYTRGSELCHAIVGPPRAIFIYLRGCNLQPSAIVRWPEKSPCFGWRCPL